MRTTPPLEPPLWLHYPLRPARTVTHTLTWLASRAGADPQSAAIETRPPANNKKSRTSRRRGTATQAEADEPREPVPPATGPLPTDALAFTEAINAQADLLEVGKRLLNSPDPRIVKGVWEHILELRYGKDTPPEESARRIVIDVERPNYDDLPAQ